MIHPHAGPGVPLRRLGAAAFLLGLVQGLGGIVRDCALTCHVGYRHAPIAFLVVAVLSLPVVTLQIQMQRRWGPELWRVRSIAGVAASLVFFRLVLLALRPVMGPLPPLSRVTYVGFFVWVDVAFMIIGAQLFGLLQGDEAETDRGLTVFASAVYAGGFLGGVIATALNGYFQNTLRLPFDVARDHLMVGMALTLLLLVPLARSSNAPLVSTAGVPPLPTAPAAADVPPSPAAPPEAGVPPAAEPGALTVALRTLAGSRDARLISASFLLASSSAICLESLFYWVLTLSTGGSGGFVPLLAKLAFWVNGVSLLLAVGGASRIIRYFGIGTAIVIVPALLLLGSGYLLVATLLLVMLGMRVLKDALGGGLYEPAAERLLVRLKGPGYAAQRPVFDVAHRVGAGLGALFVLTLTLGLDASVQTLIAFVVALHVGWLLSLIPLVRRARTAQATA